MAMPSRDWSTRDSLGLVEMFVSMLREGHGVVAGGALPGNPVDLRGLRFPAVSVCESAGVPQSVAKSICGRQTFRKGKVSAADLSGSDLSFSTWESCAFADVDFGKAVLGSCHFSGCSFDNCSFDGSDLSNARIDPDWGGRETIFSSCRFERTRWSGASCHNAVFKGTTFSSCLFGSGFVFEACAFESVVVVGTYRQLTLRGFPGDASRNRVSIDLSGALVTWLNADMGIDLSGMVLPEDGSCMVLDNRQAAMDILRKRLPDEVGAVGEIAACVLARIFSKDSVSPLSTDQQTVFVPLLLRILFL